MPDQQYTSRGFANTEITVTDYPGQTPRVLTIQESSAASEHKVWLGDRDGTDRRFHLNEDEARQVRDALTRFLGEDTDDPEPCNAETYSWDHYRPQQMDPYWIHCTRTGPHDEHSDSNTGLTWRDTTPTTTAPTKHGARRSEDTDR